MLHADDDPAAAADHRLVGVIVLVLAVIAALVVPRLISPGVVGRPAAAPLPEPPAVGSCLRATPYASVVACTEPHVAEVTKAWRAGETSSRRAVTVFGFPIDLPDQISQSDQGCYAAAMDYLGVAHEDDVGQWMAIPPLPVARYVQAPADQGIGALRWSVCVASAPAGGASFIGSVRDLARRYDHPRPAPFTNCLALGDLALRELRFVSCDHPHRIEMLGYFAVSPEMVDAGSVEAGITAGKIQSGCAELAATMMSTSDPTHAGALQVTAQALWTRAGSISIGSSPGSVVEQAGLVVPDCFVELVGGGQLTGTVIGLGEAALPLG